MIWARWLRPASGPSPLSTRLGLSAGASVYPDEALVLVTGLDASARSALMGLVGPAWLAGEGDAALIRWTPAVVAQAVGPLRTALMRLQGCASPTGRTRVMGIVNVTPDSFSDGGKYGAAAAAVAHGRALVDAGADMLDIGGESTRPGADEVSEAEELRRVLPVLEGLREVGVPLSIDTRKPGVARRAVEAGARLVNDISGLRDEAMLEVVAESGVEACLMHMQGEPKTMQAAPRYDDVMAEVLDALETTLLHAESRGVPRGRLWVDPGVGFGKTSAHNLFLLHRAGDLRLLGARVLWGVSRKRFLGELLGGRPPEARTVASAAAAALLAAQGAVDLVRVHDVAETREALAVADAIRLARDGGARFT